MKNTDDIKNYIEHSIEIKNKIKLLMNDEIKKISEIIITALKSGNKILICGNGGSATTSQHFAAELIGRFESEKKPLAAIALNNDIATISALANDYNWNIIFSRQIESIARKNDVLITITTSGNSINIIEALKTASNIGMKTICLSGKNGGKVIADLKLTIPSQKTSHIQESHLMIIHIICKLIDDEFGTNI